MYPAPKSQRDAYKVTSHSDHMEGSIGMGVNDGNEAVRRP
jgi:hypothetical protein